MYFLIILAMLFLTNNIFANTKPSSLTPMDSPIFKNVWLKDCCLINNRIEFKNQLSSYETTKGYYRSKRLAYTSKDKRNLINDSLLPIHTVYFYDKERESPLGEKWFEPAGIILLDVKYDSSGSIEYRQAYVRKKIHLGSKTLPIIVGYRLEYFGNGDIKRIKYYSNNQLCEDIEVKNKSKKIIQFKRGKKVKTIKTHLATCDYPVDYRKNF